MKKIFLTCIKLAIVLVVVFFIARAFIRDWGTVRSYEWHIDPMLLAASFLGFFAAYAVLVRIWGMVMASLGYPLRYRDAWAIYFVGNLGRYIPGKLWTVAGVAYMAGKVGVPAVVAGTAAVCAQVYSILSSFVFFALFLIFRNEDIAGLRLLWILPVPVVLIVVFMIPRNLERILNMLLRRLGREPVKLMMTARSAAAITVFYLFSWIVFGGAFWLFVAAVTGSCSFNPLFLSGAYAVSYVVGFLAFFAPGGIGIREGILTVLLSGTVPAGVAVVIAVSSRLMVTFVELVCVGVVFIQKAFSAKRTGNSS